MQQTIQFQMNFLRVPPAVPLQTASSSRPWTVAHVAAEAFTSAPVAGLAAGFHQAQLSPQLPPLVPANGRKGSSMQDSQPSGPPELDTLAVPTTAMIRRRSSATEVLLAPIMQLVTQSQRAFEFLSSGPSSEDQVIPVVETTEH